MRTSSSMVTQSWSWRWPHGSERRRRSASEASRKRGSGKRSAQSWKADARLSSSATAASPWRPVMFDTPEELLRKIRLGEDTSLECKAVSFKGDRVSEPRRHDLADEIAAIANTAEGVIVLGVDDKTKEILGVPVARLDLLERTI